MALIVTRQFYEAWARCPTDPAKALSEAQGWLARSDAAAIRVLLADTYPEPGPLDAARYAHPAWAQTGSRPAGAERAGDGAHRSGR
jgi:CHAT domain-containing protein